MLNCTKMDTYCIMFQDPMDHGGEEFYDYLWAWTVLTVLKRKETKIITVHKVCLLRLICVQECFGHKEEVAAEENTENFKQEWFHVIKSKAFVQSTIVRTSCTILHLHFPCNIYVTYLYRKQLSVFRS